MGYTGERGMAATLSRVCAHLTREYDEVSRESWFRVGPYGPAPQSSRDFYFHGETYTAILPGCRWPHADPRLAMFIQAHRSKRRRMVLCRAYKSDESRRHIEAYAHNGAPICTQPVTDLLRIPYYQQWRSCRLVPSRSTDVLAGPLAVWCGVIFHRYIFVDASFGPDKRVVVHCKKCGQQPDGRDAAHFGHYCTQDEDAAPVLILKRAKAAAADDARKQD